MTLKLVIACLVLGGLASVWLSVFRSRWRRQTLVKIGADLVRPTELLALYSHSQQSTRLIERILQQDRAIPILTIEDRVEAERLVRAFYNERGE